MIKQFSEALSIVTTCLLLCWIGSRLLFILSKRFWTKLTTCSKIWQDYKLGMRCISIYCLQHKLNFCFVESTLIFLPRFHTWNQIFWAFWKLEATLLKNENFSGLFWLVRFVWICPSEHCCLKVPTLHQRMSLCQSRNYLLIFWRAFIASFSPSHSIALFVFLLRNAIVALYPRKQQQKFLECSFLPLITCIQTHENLNESIFLTLTEPIISYPIFWRNGTGYT